MKHFGVTKLDACVRSCDPASVRQLVTQLQERRISLAVAYSHLLDDRYFVWWQLYFVLPMSIRVVIKPVDRVWRLHRTYNDACEMAWNRKSASFYLIILLKNSKDLTFNVVFHCQQILTFSCTVNIKIRWLNKNKNLMPVPCPTLTVSFVYVMHVSLPTTVDLGNTLYWQPTISVLRYTKTAKPEVITYLCQREKFNF